MNQRPKRLWHTLVPLADATRSPTADVDRGMFNASAPGHRRGIAAVLAMMFLVIFGSLATAMAIVSEGNLHTADSQIKVERAQTAAESGLNFIRYHLHQAAKEVRTDKGVIEGELATEKWNEVGQLIRGQIGADEHYTPEGGCSFVGGVLRAGPIRMGFGSPTFTIRVQPHPIAEVGYGSAAYSVDLNSSNPIARMKRAYVEKQTGEPWDSDNPGKHNDVLRNWVPGPNLIHVTVTARAGKSPNQITRSVSMDFQLTKRIDYAILAKSRIMIGQNVVVDGPIGSSFDEVQLDHGHPVQMKSDFYGLDPEGQLDNKLDQLTGSIAEHDTDGDNRLDVYNPTETQGLSEPKKLDLTNDGYIDDYDYFLARFGHTPSGGGSPRVTLGDLEDAGVKDNYRDQIVQLIDKAGNPDRVGFGDGVLDAKDHYAKIHGQVYVDATKKAWEDGAASKPYGSYQDYFKGPIVPDHNQSAITFGTDQSTSANYDADDFNLSDYEDDLTDLDKQTGVTNDPSKGKAEFTPPSEATREAVPYGAEYPYDFFERKVFDNMVFDNVRIRAGTNALFKNCKFIGVTYVETARDNDDPNYNYAGMSENQDGDEKYPNISANVDGEDQPDTKKTSNNIRFYNCTFEGSVVAGTPNGKAPKAFTHTRNKLAFTGDTKFADVNDPTKTPDLTEAERRKFSRSRLMAPNFSVEMGTFAEPANSNETVNLSGTIVAGLIDMRGQVEIDGTLLTTFKPKSNEGPVVGQTSPQFNTTLGYFASEEGDLEAEIPPQGMGVIHVRYDPTLPPPDGIDGPIKIKPLTRTYSEGGR